jgi:CRP-like cAMP-binding protein
MDAAQALRASPLFQSFTDMGIGILAGICTQRSYPAGTPLFVENMVADSMLVIADGRVGLTTTTDKGEVPLGELTAGDWLGELSLINTGQRMCTARATSPVSAFEIRQADFQRLTGSKPQACMKLLMSICTAFGQKVQANRDSLRSLVTRT